MCDFQAAVNDATNGEYAARLVNDRGMPSCEGLQDPPSPSTYDKDIRNEGSEKCLDLSISVFPIVGQESCNGLAEQRLIEVPVDGGFLLQFENTDRCLEASYGTRSSDLHHWTCTAVDYMTFNWDDGQLRSNYSGLCFTVDGDRVNRGARLQMHPCTNSPFQRFNTDVDTRTKVNIASGSVKETDGFAGVSVELEQTIAEDCTVTVFSRPGSATAGEDYYSATETLVFPAGTSNNSFSVAILTDNIEEQTETLSVSLIGSENCVAGRSGEISILDAPGLPAISVASSEVREDDKSAPVKVSLSQAGESLCSVRISSRRDSATPGQDYYGSTRLVEFNPGEVEKVVNFEILDDTVSESNESFVVGQASATNCIQGNDASVLIIDND